jgi:hypothetical protein
MVMSDSSPESDDQPPRSHACVIRDDFEALTGGESRCRREQRRFGGRPIARAAGRLQ